MAYEYEGYEDETGGGGGAFVMGLLAGAVLGAGIGMLMAPKPGSELRGQLGDTASRLKGRAADGYSAASSKVTDLYNRSTGSSEPNGPGNTSTGTAGFASTGAPTTTREF